MLGARAGRTLLNGSDPDVLSRLARPPHSAERPSFGSDSRIVEVLLETDSNPVTPTF